MAEVGSAYFTLLPSVRGLQGAIAREVSSVDGTGAGRTIGNGMGSGIVGRLKAIVGPAIATFATVKAFGFAKDAVNSFSELEDSSAAAEVVFSGNVGKIMALSKTASTSIGLNSQQVVSSAQSFGTFGKAAGLAGSDLEDFAVEMTTLTGDLASFTGKSVEDSITAVGAAMRGEFEPIRAFGVLLDDATLREEALALGLIKSTKEALTPANKTLAARSAILKQTKDAQGDFNRTADSTANVQKTLAAETENLSAKIGSVLAPAFTAVRLKAIDGVRGVSTFLDKGIALKEFIAAGGGDSNAMAEALGVGPATAEKIINGLNLFDNFKVGVSDVFAKIGAVVQSSGLGNLMTVLQTSFGPLVPLVGQLWAAMSPLGIVFQSLAPVLPALVGAFGQFAATLGATLGGALVVVVPILTELSGVLVDSLGTVFATLAPLIVTALAQISSHFVALAPVIIEIVGAVVTLAAGLISQLAPILASLATAILPVVFEALGVLISVIAPVISIIAEALIPVIQQLMPIVVTVFEVIANVVRAAMTIVQGIIQVVTGVISGNWSQVWDGIVNILRGAWDLIKAVTTGALSIIGSVISSGFNAVWSLVQSVFTNVVNFVRTSFSSVVEGARGMIGDVVGFFSGLGGKITGALSGIGTLLFSTGKNIVQGLIDGIGSMIGAIGRAVVNIVPAAIRGPFEALLGIKSPSRLAMWWGEMLGDGLVLGIDASTSKVAGSSASLARAAMPSIAMAGTRSTYLPTAGVGLGGETIQIDVHGDMYGNAREVAEEVLREKKRAVQVHNIDAIAAGV